MQKYKLVNKLEALTEKIKKCDSPNNCIKRRNRPMSGEMSCVVISKWMAL